MRQIHQKFALLAASTALAMAFTVSCSNDDDNNSGSDSPFIDVETYKIISIEDDHIVYEYKEEGYYICTEDGLEKSEGYSGSNEINYSIENKVLNAWLSNKERASKFNGNSNEVVGTWTRNKDMKSSCKQIYDEEDDYTYIRCEYFYDVTKMEITTSTFTMTREYCVTDRLMDGEEEKGYKMYATGCNSYEMRKGSDVVTIKMIIKNNFEGYNMEATYKGKTCKLSYGEPTKSEQEKACKEANKSGEDYSDIIDAIEEKANDNFEKCLKDKGFPKELQSSDEEKSSTMSLKKIAKMAAKAKTSPR